MKFELAKDLSYHFGQGDIAVIPKGTKVFQPKDSEKFRIWVWPNMRAEERDWHKNVGFFADASEVLVIRSKLESIAYAAVLGQRAFLNGIGAAPALDRDLQPLLAQWGTDSLASPKPAHTKVLLSILTAWSRAWHAANLAAPLPCV